MSGGSRKGHFLTLGGKDDKEKFMHLLNSVTTVREMFISESHKKAMAVEGDDVGTVYPSHKRIRSSIY